MKICHLFFIVSLAAINFAQAQTLFTYGTHSVSKDEFLQAFNKNPDTTGNRKEKLQEYLELYINFKLKLQDAYDEKVNTNADLKTEAENFKAQLADNFINQQADINQLMQEAFLRSQKDILLQQVFVQLPAGGDTTGVYALISKAYEELKAGKNFEDVSATYSSDSAIRLAKGSIGYVTAFTLPYSIEDIVYKLNPGEFSGIYKSSAGYHIFKKVAERPALGRKKIEQLLFTTPPFYTAKQFNATAHLADSVYTVLQSGVSFESMLPLYGHNFYDFGDANIIEVKVGDYNADFEKEVFNLKTPGEISKPFKTEYGYNIIKLIESLPVPANDTDVSFAAYIQTQIQNDGRLEAAKRNLINKWLKETGFREASYQKQDLWLYSDSALNDPDALPASYKNIQPATVLFQFNNKKINVKNWIDYLRSLVINRDKTARATYAEKMQSFIRSECNNYYRENITDFDTAALAQIKEFNEANLLFYVMDKKVWSKALTDSVGLKKYYEAHKPDYTWKPGVAALIVSAPDKNLADSIAMKLKSNPAGWRKLLSSYGNSVIIDSSRFENDQVPVKQQIVFEKGFETKPELNEAGNSYTFVHVFNVYTQPEQRSFEEAKGMVINDYQQELEKEWISNLKKAYPVRINDAVVAKLH